MKRGAMVLAAVMAVVLAVPVMASAGVVGKWNTSGTIKGCVDVGTTICSDSYSINENFTFKRDGKFVMTGGVTGTWKMTSDTNYKVLLNKEQIKNAVNAILAAEGFDAVITEVKTAVITGTQKSKTAIKGTMKLSCTFLYMGIFPGEGTAKYVFNGTKATTLQVEGLTLEFLAASIMGAVAGN
jgi:hypothetical protein